MGEPTNDDYNNLKDGITDDDYAKVWNDMKTILAKYDQNTLDTKKVDDQVRQLVNRAEREIAEEARLREEDRRRERSAWQKIKKGQNPFKVCLNDGCFNAALLHEEFNTDICFCCPACQIVYHEKLAFGNLSEAGLT
jgi:hypothetical protein